MSSMTSTFLWSTSRRLSPGVVWWPAVITMMSSRSISSRPRPRTVMLRQQRPRVHEVERETARGVAVAGVDGHPPGQPSDDERRCRRDADPADPQHAHRQACHLARAPPCRTAVADTLGAGVRERLGSELAERTREPRAQKPCARRSSWSGSGAPAVVGAIGGVSFRTKSRVAAKPLAGAPVPIRGGTRSCSCWIDRHAARR